MEPTGPVLRDPRFNESRRTEPWGDDYRQRRLEYVAGTDHPSWEPRSEVAERFDGAIAEHFGAAHGRPLVVAGHGLAMTVWLTARIGLTAPGDFWADLRFPDALRVDLVAGRRSELSR